MNIETTLAEMKEGDDWGQAFICAFNDQRTVTNCPPCSTVSFDMEDIAEVLASCEGQNDGDSWLALFRLKDGRYAYLSAWCDYTGWG